MDRRENPGGYCSFDDQRSCTDDNCRALAAGCGVSLFDLVGTANCGDGNPFCGRTGTTHYSTPTGAPLHCGEWGIATGQCDVCRTPHWCDDNRTWLASWGSVHTPDEWADEFFDRDGGSHYGARQCKFKPSQRETYLRTVHKRHALRQGLDMDWLGRHHDHANTWNEVNMYVDPHNRSMDGRVFDALLGLVYVRTAGNSEQLTTILEVAAHWRSMGKDVPVFAVNAEELEKVNIWKPDVLVNLLDPAYNFEEIVLDLANSTSPPLNHD